VSVKLTMPAGRIRHAIKAPVLAPDGKGFLSPVVTGIEDLTVEVVVDPYELLMAYGQRLAETKEGELRVAGDGVVLRVVRRELTHRNPLRMPPGSSDA